MLRAPHLVLEGMIVAGLAVGASRGWVYLRHEYPEQRDRMRAEIETVRRDGSAGSECIWLRPVIRHRNLRQPGELYLRRTDRTHRSPGGQSRGTA